MTAFAPMLRLSVEHAFWGDRPPPVTLEPDAATSRLLNLSSLAARFASASVTIVADTDRDVLRDAAGGDVISMRFRVRVTEPDLATHTDIIDLTGDQIAVISVEAGAVTELEATDMRDRQVDDVLTAEDVRMPPLAVLLVDVPVDATDDVRAARFRASERRWTYHVIGGAAEGALQVRDPEGRVAFTSLGLTSMANGRDARSFQSEIAIEASARPPQRFELLASGDHGDRVLIPVLPTPGPGAFRPARADPGGPPISEIYVNLP